VRGSAGPKAVVSRANVRWQGVRVWGKWNREASLLGEALGEVAHSRAPTAAAAGRVPPNARRE
jgi:hypothetical protein